MLVHRQTDRQDNPQPASQQVTIIMTRATQYLRKILLFLSLWIVLIIFRSTLIPSQYNFLLFSTPLIALFLFGLYAACNILYHLVTFKECPQAFMELQKEIAEAKNDLKRRGIKL